MNPDNRRKLLGWETGIENTLKQQQKNLHAHR